MNKILKYIISISMGWAILMIPTMNVSANEGIHFKDIEVTETNEYLSIVNEIEQLEKELISNRLSVEKYNPYSEWQQKEEEFKQYIYSLKELPISELKASNFTDAQIEARVFKSIDEIANGWNEEHYSYRTYYL